MQTSHVATVSMPHEFCPPPSSDIEHSFDADVPIDTTMYGLGRCTYARFGITALVASLRALGPSAPSFSLTPFAEPVTLGGAEEILSSWAIFRSDEVVRAPPTSLRSRLSDLGCHFDEEIRGWVAPAEEIEVLEDGTVVHEWPTDERGVRTPPSQVTSLISEVEALATAPEHVATAAKAHYAKLQRNVEKMNESINIDYRQRVQDAVSRGECTWRDASPHSFTELQPTCRQARRRYERLRRRDNRRGLQPSPAMVAIAEGHEFAKSDEPESLTAEAEPTVEDPVQPLVFMPETRRFPAWSEFHFKVRVAKAATVGKTIAIFPLEDKDAQSLDVMIAPSIGVVDENGYTTVRGINPHGRPVSVSLLTAIGRFIIDPRVSTLNLEFTTDQILERIHLPKDITPDELEYVRAMIHQRRRLFATTLGWAHGYKQKIETPLIDSGEAQPPAFPMRQRSPGEWAVLKEFVDKQLKQRLIEPCVSPYNAVPMAVKKPDGTQRVVIDLRALNALCKRDVYPLPNVQANLNKLGRATHFTAIDLLMGFHQCELEEDSKLKTAFGTPWGQMCYTRMPMGLTSSPGAFMRLVDASLKGLDPSIITPYMDDILISTNGTFNDHIDAVDKVFEKLIASGFTVRCDKCSLAMKDVGYLGFLVGAYGTRPDPKKTKPITDMRIDALQRDPAAPGRFAGMAAFYQRHIPNCAYMLQPFYDLRQKNANFKEAVHTLRFMAAFEALKHAVSTATALNRPDYSKPFYIDVDAATVGGVGAVISQRDDADDPESHRPLAFYSRRFNPTERGYPVRDQECMGLVEAVTEWRPYVLGARTIVRTDHKSLKWLMASQHADGSRVAGWALKIQEYGIEIEYIKGKDNIVPDCISRSVANLHAHQSSPTVCDLTINSDAQPFIHVSTSGGPRNPAKLLQLGVCDFKGNPIPGVSIDMNICDTGSGAEIMGVKQYELLRRLAPTCIRTRPAPLPTSLTRITGVGNGFTRVKCHCELMLNFGGKPVYYEDIAVLEGHDGILLGNETLNKGMAVIKYEGNCGGYVRLRDDSEQWISEPVPFTVARQSSAACFAISSPPPTPQVDAVTALLHAAIFQPNQWPITATLTLEAPSQHRQHRISIVVIDDHLRVLAERQGSALSLPSLAPPSNSQIRRLDICHHLADQFEDAEHIFPAIMNVQISGSCYPNEIGLATDQYFVVVLPRGVHLPACHRHPTTTAEHFDIEATDAIPDEDNSAFLNRLFDIVSNSHQRSPARTWRLDRAYNAIRRLRALVGGRNRGRKIAHKTQQPTSAHCMAISRAIGSGIVDSVVPRFAAQPNGPALCKSTHEINSACRLLHRRLTGHNNTLAIDLEGELGGPHSHVAKIQVAIDADGDRPPLIFVIDSHANPGAVKARGPDSFRALMESYDIVKVFHHCRGDTSSLFYQFGIITNNVFDTAVADCLLTNRHYNSSRGLETVLLHWLGAEVVHLQFKGKLVHVPRMFEEDPLPYHLFVYAYEDVLHLCLLYHILNRGLRERHLDAAHHSLSSIRSPPRAIPVHHPSFTPPRSIAIALTDTHHVVCIRDVSTGKLRLPTGLITSPYSSSTHSVLKKQASKIWVGELGKPPKGIAAAVNAKLRSPIRFAATPGDVLVYEARVEDCVARVGALRDALSIHQPEGGTEVILRRRGDLDDVKHLFRSDQVAALQFLGVLFFPPPSVRHELTVHSPPQEPGGQAQATADLDNRESVPTLRVHPHLRACGTNVTLSLSVNVIAAARSADAYIVTGKVVTEKRAAIILFDPTFHALSLTVDGQKGTPNLRAWPSAPIYVGEEPEDAAVRAFDIYAGPSIRKGCSGPVPATGALSPIFGHTISKIFRDDLFNVGEFGNTVYFAAKFGGMVVRPATVALKLAPKSGTVEAELSVNADSHYDTLYDCGSIFHASRRACNGFKLLPSLAAKNSYIDLIDITKNPNLSTYDQRAADILITTAHPVTCAIQAPLSEERRIPDPERSVAVAHDSAEKPDSIIPDLGEDPAFDRLFNAYVSLLLGDAVSKDHDHNHASVFAGEGEPDILVDWGPESFGGRSARETCNPTESKKQDGRRNVSSSDIREEQQTHPATGGLIHFLLTGDVDESWGQSRKQLERLGKTHFLNDEGVLCHNSGKPRSPDRIVLPPRFHFWCCRQYHSLWGHSGTKKTFKLISRRYIWGTDESMKNDITLFIRHCQSCSRLKLGRHPVGQGHIVDQGRGPFDIIDTDVYKTGVTADTGEDTIISFADHFTRLVLASARKGDPTSEDFADTLVNAVISYYGVPRVIRSDHASVLISAGIKKLYSIFNITSSPGNPYIHRSIGLVERWHSTLKHLLLTLKISKTVGQWPRYLPLLQLAFNTSVAHATGYSPFFLNHIRHPNLPVDNISIERKHLSVSDMPSWVARSLNTLQVSFDAAGQKLTTYQLHAKRVWDLKHDVVTKYNVGDRVLVVKGTVIDGVHPKNNEPTHGPFTVLECLPKDNYRLGDLHNQRLHDEFHISRLRPAASRAKFSDAQESLLYPVQAIVGHRIRDIPADKRGVLAFAAGSKIVEYLIRWRGFASGYDSYRSVHFLDNIFELVAAYREMLHAQGHAPLPDELPPLPVVQRNVPPPTSVEPDAVKRKTFRFSNMPPANEAPSTAKGVTKATGAAALEDIYPVGSPVQVHLPGGWRNGTVTQSFVSKRAATRPRERRVIISFEDAGLPGLFEYGLQSIPIRMRVVNPTASPATEPVEDPEPQVDEPQQKGIPLRARFVKQQGWLYECVTEHRGRDVRRWLPAGAFKDKGQDLLTALRERAQADVNIVHLSRCAGCTPRRRISMCAREPPRCDAWECALECGAAQPCICCLNDQLDEPLKALQGQFKGETCKDYDILALDASRYGRPLEPPSWTRVAATSRLPASFDLEVDNWISIPISLEGSMLGSSSPPSFRSASVVYRRVGASWVRWLLVARSAALASIGVTEWGLYSLRHFSGNPTRGDIIADRYPGNVVHSGVNLDTPASRAIVTQLVASRDDRLLTVVRGDGTGVKDIISGAGLPPVWRANAATNIPNVHKSFRFSKSGSSIAVRRIDPVPESFTALPISALLGYELLTTYQSAYWHLIRQVGTSRLPIDLDPDPNLVATSLYTIPDDNSEYVHTARVRASVVATTSCAAQLRLIIF